MTFTPQIQKKIFMLLAFPWLLWKNYRSAHENETAEETKNFSMLCNNILLLLLPVLEFFTNNNVEKRSFRFSLCIFFVETIIFFLYPADAWFLFFLPLRNFHAISGVFEEIWSNFGAHNYSGRVFKEFFSNFAAHNQSALWIWKLIEISGAYWMKTWSGKTKASPEFN